VYANPSAAMAFSSLPSHKGRLPGLDPGIRAFAR
jgi:hypothetical protein